MSDDTQKRRIQRAGVVTDSTKTDSTKTPEVKNVCNNNNFTYSRIIETNI